MGAIDRFLKRGRLQDFSRGPIAKMLSELRKFGANGHLYIPGIGVISGLTAGNYLDSIGTTNANVDGNVGLVLDGAGSVGSELAGLSSAWSSYGAGISLSGGKMVFAATPAGQSTMRGTPIVAGKTYLLEFVVDSISGGGINMLVGGGAGTAIATAPGYYRGIVKATNIDGPYLWVNTATTTAVVSVASCKEVTGIHASQDTTGYQPKLRRGIVNLLLSSNDVQGWNKVGVSTPSYNRIVADTSTGYHACYRSFVGMPSSVNYTMAFIVEKAEYTKAVLADSSGGRYFVNVDLTTGSVINSGGMGGLISCSVAQVSTNRFLIAATFTVISGALGCGLTGYPNSGATIGNYGAQYTGDGASGIYVHGGGLFQGTLTAQQILANGGVLLTTTAAASSSTGAYKWDLDGDDFLSLGAIPFQMADDHCVIAAVHPNSTNIGKHILNPANGAASQQVGCIRVDGASKYTASWCDDSTTVASVADSVALNVGESSVVTARKVGSTGALRKNGLQIGSTSLSAIGATTLTLPGVLGAFKSGAAASNIHLHGAAVIKGTVTDAQALIFERGLNALSQYAAGRF